jgi:hypothetical protein
MRDAWFQFQRPRVDSIRFSNARRRLTRAGFFFQKKTTVSNKPRRASDEYMFSRARRVASRVTARDGPSRGRGVGVKFRIDFEPVDVCWTTTATQDDDDDLRNEDAVAGHASTTGRGRNDGTRIADDERHRFVIRVCRGAKVQTSEPSRDAETSADGRGFIAEWAPTPTSEREHRHRSSLIATFFKSKPGDGDGGGVGFDAKEYAVKLQRERRVVNRKGDEEYAYETIAKSSFDFTTFATLSDESDVRGEHPREFVLPVKKGARGMGEATSVRCRAVVRVVWLKNFNQTPDALTELSFVSGLDSVSESVATDVTPPQSIAALGEQDLAGFQNLLSPVAESVSPIVVRQTERRETAAREEARDAMNRVAELEVSLERAHAKVEDVNQELAKRQHEFENDLARARRENAAMKETVASTQEAKERAITRVLDDMNAVEAEKTRLEKHNRNLEYELETVKRTLRERDLDLARAQASRAKMDEEDEESKAHFELERASHAKEIARYHAQLEAADEQLEKLLENQKKTQIEFERELERQSAARADAEHKIMNELEEKSHECEDLRQQLQNIIAETTLLTTAMKKQANEQQGKLVNMAKAEAAQAKCDLRAVTEELVDVRKVLDSHVNELVACKVSMAEDQGSLLVLRRELTRCREKLTEYAARATRMEVCMYEQRAEEFE